MDMLGETANIRSNAIPYFQIFIIFDKVPYYEAGGRFKKYDIITQHNLNKYLLLSQDNPSILYHTPDKTLIILLKLKEKTPNYIFSNVADYASYYKEVIDDNDLISYSNAISDTFGQSVILNNYSDFMKRTSAIIIGSGKESHL